MLRGICAKQKGLCTEGDACSFRHDESTRGKVTHSFSAAPRPQTQATEHVLRKGSLPEDVVILRIRHVIDGILPCVKSTSQNRGRESVLEDF